MTDHTATIYFAAVAIAAISLCVYYELARRRERKRALTATRTGVKLLALLMEAREREFEWNFTRAPECARPEAR